MLRIDLCNTESVIQSLYDVGLEKNVPQNLYHKFVSETVLQITVPPLNFS